MHRLVLAAIFLMIFLTACANRSAVDAMLLQPTCNIYEEEPPQELPTFCWSGLYMYVVEGSVDAAGLTARIVNNTTANLHGYRGQFMLEQYASGGWTLLPNRVTSWFGGEWHRHSDTPYDYIESDISWEFSRGLLPPGKYRITRTLWLNDVPTNHRRHTPRDQISAIFTIPYEYGYCLLAMPSGLSMYVVEGTANFRNLRLHTINNSDNTYASSQSNFNIQQLVNDEWIQLHNTLRGSFITSSAVHAPATYIPSYIHLDIMYGQLPPGHYRIFKSFAHGHSYYIPIGERFYLYAPFTIYPICDICTPVSQHYNRGGFDARRLGVLPPGFFVPRSNGCWYGLGMEIVPDSVTPTGLTLEITSVTAQRHSHELRYSIQRYVNGTWQPVLPLIEQPWFFTMQGIMPQTVNLQEADWTQTYGKLPPGQYRLVLRFMDCRATPSQVWDEQFVTGIHLYAMFEVQ